MKKSDQRTRLTRLLIRQSLTRLLSQKPIQSISVRELCDGAGINRGTFYAHYKDIYDLLAQLEQDMLDGFQKALEPLLDGREGFSPLKVTSGMFACTGEHADLCGVILGPNGDKRFAARLLELGREKCVACYSKLYPNATPQQLDGYYTFVSGGCISLLERWLREGMPFPSAQLAKMAEGIMLSGINFLES